jgi:hypothetical protein
MDFEDEARRVVASVLDEADDGPSLGEAIAAALRGAYAEGARPCVDIFDDFDETEIRSETTSVREAWATGRDIRDRLAPPAPKPDAPFGHISRADETQLDEAPVGVSADVCGKPCAHGSECLVLAGHDGGHETQHGCIFYDPRPPAPPNPVSQPTAQPNGGGDALGKPVTYRAGTVPPVVRVGMVLRSPGGKARVVEQATDAYVYFEGGQCYLSCVVRDWPLARDFTESCADIEERNK